MKNMIGKINIERYQLEDMANMLLTNNYCLEIQNYNNDKIQISIYEYNESEEKGNGKN